MAGHRAEANARNRSAAPVQGEHHRLALRRQAAPPVRRRRSRAIPARPPHPSIIRAAYTTTVATVATNLLQIASTSMSPIVIMASRRSRGFRRSPALAQQPVKTAAKNCPPSRAHSTDLSRCSKRQLLDHLVGAREQRRRNCDSDRLRSPVVDDQLEPR